MMMVWSGSDIIMQACAEADGFIGSAVWTAATMVTLYNHSLFLHKRYYLLSTQTQIFYLNLFFSIWN